MAVSLFPAYALSAAFLAVGGCASIGTIVPPEVPANLRPPAGEVLFLEAHGSGVQIYDCALRSGQPLTYEWAFRAPEAALVDRSGRSVGKHYAGPTWESTDGSSVIGVVKARDPGPSAKAIPWLLLTAKATAGSGMFTATTSVQRVQTVGGIAPSEECGASNVKQVARVPYTATYFFYRAAQ
jgi:Protein of unknown function (DUF3455)